MRNSVILMVSLVSFAILGAVLLARMFFGKDPSKKINWLRLIDLCVLELMTLYLLVRLIVFEQGMNSAPGWVVLFEAVYFLVPLGVVNLGYYVVKKLSHT